MDILCFLTIILVKLIHKKNGIMMAYIGLRNMIVSCLKLDSQAHETGSYDQFGIHFDFVADSCDSLLQFIESGSPEYNRLNTAMAFWNAWIGARYHNWQNSYDIEEADWPRLAQRLAKDLAADLDATDQTVQLHFDVSQYRNR